MNIGMWNIENTQDWTMITINSYLHRSTLNNIIRRWMYGEVYSSDADLINRIVHFNNIYVSRYLNLFSEVDLWFGLW